MLYTTHGQLKKQLHIRSTGYGAIIKTIRNKPNAMQWAKENIN